VPALPALSGAPMIGRDDALWRLETAWNAGQIVFVSGEPGVGKSRLLTEFAAAKNVLYAHGRAGDARMPFSTQVRTLRRLLADHPALQLPRWVRSELSKILPELEGDAPSGGPEARLRLFEACAEFT
jgi:AAA ATPase domain